MGAFFAELKRRHIYRVAAAYAVVAWVLIQLVNNLTPMLKLGDWVGTLVFVLLLVGFPIALLFCWIQHLAPADSAAPSAKATRLDWAIMGALVAVLAGVSYQQLATAPGARPVSQQANLTSAPSPGPPGVISIAVLPFVNLSSDAEQEFFSDGMTEEITAALAKVQELHVVARTSAFEFKGQNRNIRAIGESLGAGYVIEGSVRKAGDRVRITAQLIKANDGTHLWTENYDRDLTDIFAVQEDIARAIAASLRVPLGLQQGDSLVRNRTADLESYQQYLRARALVRARAVNDAIAILEPIVARNPDYAPAWAMLAYSYSLTLAYTPVWRTGSVEEARRSIQSGFDKGEVAAQKSIELDPQFAVGYAALAYIRSIRMKWAEGDDLFRRALALDPSDPEVLQTYRQSLSVAGHLKESLRLSEQLQTLEPFVPVFTLTTAYIKQINGQSAATIPLMEALSADAAISFNRNTRLAMAYAAAGRYGEAADTILAIRGALISRQSVEAAAGLIRTPMPVSAPEKLPRLDNDLNFVYAYVGARERVFESEERNLQIGIFPNPFWLWDPLYAPLRKTERFKTLMRNAGLVDYWRAHGWPDLCRPMGADDFACD